MKKLILLSSLVLISTSLFSCTADDVENTSNSTAKVKLTNEPTKVQASYEEGPGDDPINVNPPPRK
jgi:hypothetical protein